MSKKLLGHIPLILSMFAVAVATTAASAYSADNDTKAAVVTDTIAPTDSLPKLALYDRDTLDGLSGRLWMKAMPFQPGDTAGIIARLFGDSAARQPGGVYESRIAGYASAFTFVSLVPFSDKKKGVVGDYRMGLWPAERRVTSDEAYANPSGFIRVTAQNQDYRVSPHFRLGDFLTKDQKSTWPKYLVLEENLVDKLELVITALGKGGVKVVRMSVMSGFRTPQYNEKGVGAGGRSDVSRHQYGDAADVFIDNDYSGGMDDLNGDGRVNTDDAHFLAKFVAQVELDYPELTGGIGVYPATSAHGPFVHIDVRGVKARW
jgi:uncharacterized protein YcbK (DUF882 family)